MNENELKINLDDPDTMALSEAAKLWNRESSYMTRTPEQFPEGTIRKFGKVWLVTREGMEARYGPQPGAEE